MQHHVNLRHTHISTLIQKMSYKTKQKQPTWRESSCLILITNEPCEARQQPKSACVQLDRNDTLFSYSNFSPGNYSPTQLRVNLSIFWKKDLTTNLSNFWSSQQERKRYLFLFPCAQVRIFYFMTLFTLFLFTRAFTWKMK